MSVSLVSRTLAAPVVWWVAVKDTGIGNDIEQLVALRSCSPRPEHRTPASLWRQCGYLTISKELVEPMADRWRSRGSTLAGGSGSISPRHLRACWSRPRWTRLPAPSFQWPCVWSADRQRQRTRHQGGVLAVKFRASQVTLG